MCSVEFSSDVIPIPVKRCQYALNRSNQLRLVVRGVVGLDRFVGESDPVSRSLLVVDDHSWKFKGSGISGIRLRAGTRHTRILPVVGFVFTPGEEVYSVVSATLTVQLIHQVIPAFFDRIAGLLEE